MTSKAFSHLRDGYPAFSFRSYLDSQSKLLFKFNKVLDGQQLVLVKRRLPLAGFISFKLVIGIKILDRSSGRYAVDFDTMTGGV